MKNSGFKARFTSLNILTNLLARRIYRLLIFLFLAQIIPFYSFAQVDLVKRVEVENGKDEYPQTPIKLENSLIYYSYNDYKNRGDIVWKFKKYDTNLELIRSAEIGVDLYETRGTYTTDAYHFVMCVNSDKAYKLHQIDLNTLEHKVIHEGVFETSNSAQIYVWDLVVEDDMIYAHTGHLYGFMWLKYYSTLSCIDMSKNTMQVIEFKPKDFDAKHVRLEQIKPNKSEEDLVLIFSTTEKKKGTDYFVNRYNLSGSEKLGSFCLTCDKNIDLVNLSVKPLGNSSYLFSGSYETSRAKENKRVIVMPEFQKESGGGFFMCKTTSDKIDFFESYDYLELENFLSFLPNRTQDKIEKKEERKRKKGKTYEYRTDMICHDILPYKNNYILIGEAFYRTYKTVYDSDGKARTVFDGYQYTHSTIICFDPSGKIIWDKAFDMYSDPKPFEKIKFIAPTLIGDELQLRYMSRYETRLMTFNATNGRVLFERSASFSSIETGTGSDKIKWVRSDLYYWRDDALLSYGRALIKDRAENEKRKVYYINLFKVSLH